MGCRISLWFAGLPAAFRGWKLEAVKQAGGDPPVRKGAGYNEVYTAAAGHIFQTGCFPVFFQVYFRNFFYDFVLAQRTFIRYNNQVR